LSDAKFLRLYLYHSFMHVMSDIVGIQIRDFEFGQRISWSRIQINLHLTSKISLKFNLAEIYF